MRINQSKVPSAWLATSKKGYRVWSILLVVIVFSSVGVAHGQETARGQGVMDRARPDFDAMGVRLGSFLAYPAAEARVGYDDNILAADTNEVDDAVFTLTPSMLLESNWSQHFLSIAADSTSVLYANETNEDHVDWGVAGTGRLDLLESSDIETSISFQNRTEPREAIDAVSVVEEPTEYDQFDVSGAWNHRFNRASISLGGGYTRLNYDDSPMIGGGTVDQDFRDRDIVQGIGQLGYKFAAGHSAFVRGVFNDRDYRKSPPSVAFDRDSDGFEINAGWAAEITNLIAGEVYVGYLDQRYDSGVFEDVDGVSFGLNLEWYVTELTTVRVAVSRDVVDSTAAGTGGILRSAASIGADHELARNVLLLGEVSYYNGDFKGNGREDNWIGASVGVKYLLNRRVHIDLDYNFSNRATNAANLDYLRNRVSLGVRFQL